MRGRIAFILILFFLIGAKSTFAAPQKVYTGLYLMNLYDLNMDEHSFYADFYIWFKWKGEINPCDIEFVNSIERWDMDFARSGDGSDSLLADGSQYRIFRVEGRFFHSYELRRFPLDKHILDIQIEHPEYDVNELVYLPDSNGAAIRESLSLVGWRTVKCDLTPGENEYGTNFGNPVENAHRYSNLKFNITLSRPYSYFLLQMLLPLIIVMLVSIGALLLHPSYTDMRSSLPIGGLLTAVFLQQGYGDALPAAGYMVLMDKIYLFSYIIISVVLFKVIRSGNKILKESEVNDIHSFERKMAQGLTFLFALGILLLCVFS